MLLRHRHRCAGRAARRQHDAWRRSGEYLNVDTLAYLDLDRLVEATGAVGAGFCDACFTGTTPSAVPVTPVQARAARSPPRRSTGPSRPDGDRLDHGHELRRRRRLHLRGEEAVERIKSKVRSTFRPEVIGDIGGFGGLFAFAQHRYRHPVLVSSTDGVGTKALVAQAAGRFDTIGVDLVAMCVDDLVCQGAEPLFFLDYIAVGKLDPDHIEQLVEGVAHGLPPGRLRPGGRARWPSTPAPWNRVSSTSSASPWAWSSGTGSSPGQHIRPGDVAHRPAVARTSAPTATRWPATVLLEVAGRSLDEPAWPGRAPHPGRGAARAVGRLRPGHLRPAAPRRRPRHRPTSPAAACPATCPAHPARGHDAIDIERRSGGAPHLR